MTERKTETPSKGILKCTLNLLICYFYILSGITGIIGIIGKIGISGIIGIIIPDRYKSFLPPLSNYFPFSVRLYKFIKNNFGTSPRYFEPSCF